MNEVIEELVMLYEAPELQRLHSIHERRAKTVRQLVLAGKLPVSKLKGELARGAIVTNELARRGILPNSNE